MRQSVIVSAARTAIGEFGGSLRSVPPMDLAQHVIKEVLSRSKLPADWIDRVIFGCCLAPVEKNIARNAAYRAGIPKEAPAFTINSTCGSSLQAIISAVQSISCGESDTVLAGGVESMSNSPYIMESVRWGKRLQHAQAFDLVWGVMQEPLIGVGMGLTAENLAQKFNITRQEQDAFAYLSHQRATNALKEGKFLNEITSFPVPSKKKGQIIFDTDEHVRPDTSLESLAKLQPIFTENGTVTAGNACGINDAASAVIPISQEKAHQSNLKPLAKIRAYHVAGVDPDFMGIGPVPAIRGVLRKANLNLTDIDRFEINEAFAAQYLSCERELGLDRARVNVYGSGISLGHPVGATGCRLVVTLLHSIIADDLNLGLASLCAGGGMGFALVLERI